MNDSYIGSTVREFLSQLEKSKVEYAVLRNYENLPEIGNDLDLVVNFKKFNLLKSILLNIQDEFSWDALVEIKLWESHVQDFSIRVFKFYNFSKKVCLQLDFFGGFSILSAPGFSQNDLLNRRVKVSFFYKISESDEILMRYMQLACAIRDNEKSRVIRLKKIIKILGGNETIKSSIKNLPINILAPKLFKCNNKVKNGYKIFKFKYLLKFLFRSPFLILLRFCERIRFRLKLYSFSIPGVIIIFNKKSFDLNKKIITNELNLLKKNKVVSKFQILQKLNLFNFIRNYNILFKGGLIIYYSKLSNLNYSENIILKKIIQRYD